MWDYWLGPLNFRKELPREYTIFHVMLPEMHFERYCTYLLRFPNSFRNPIGDLSWEVGTQLASYYHGGGYAHRADAEQSCIDQSCIGQSLLTDCGRIKSLPVD